MILLVLVLAAVIALSGGFIVGVVAGVQLERSRRDAGGIAPHEALRPLYRDDEAERLWSRPFGASGWRWP